METSTKKTFLFICGLAFAFLSGVYVAYYVMDTEVEKIVRRVAKEAITETEVHPYTCDCSYEATIVTELIQSLANKNDELWEMYLACSEGGNQ